MSNDPPAWPGGVGRLILAEAPSTNAEALRLAPTLDRPTWILARRQTAGRGRRGRIWADPAGNFAASHVMAASEPPDRLALRSFVAALAVTDALAALGVAGGRASLKWPNDVLLDDAKIAGILLESTGSHLAIGIGVNLADAPPADMLEPGAVPPTSLRAAGVEVTAEVFLDRLAPAFAARQAVLQDKGFGPIRDAWLARAARRGATITARMPRRAVTGRFEGIDETGAILLATAGGPVAIAAADIQF